MNVIIIILNILYEIATMNDWIWIKSRITTEFQLTIVKIWNALTNETRFVSCGCGVQ